MIDCIHRVGFQPIDGKIEDHCNLKLKKRKWFSEETKCQKCEKYKIRHNETSHPETG
jgi:hypothetical protein